MARVMEGQYSTGRAGELLYPRPLAGEGGAKRRERVSVTSKMALARGPPPLAPSPALSRKRAREIKLIAARACRATFSAWFVSENVAQQARAAMKIQLSDSRSG